MATAIEILQQKSRLSQKQAEMTAIVEEMNVFFDGLPSYQRLYFEDILPEDASRSSIDLAEFQIKTVNGTIDSLSPEELRAAKQMYILCKDFIAADRYKSEESEREY